VVQRSVFRGALLLVCALPGALAALPTAEAQALEPERVRSIADRIAAAWPERQLPDGRFRDYLSGRAPSSYGVTMLGYGLLRSGERTDDRKRIDAGVRALDAATKLPAAERGSFDLLAFSSAYNFARTKLAGDPAFGRARAGWERHLLGYSRPRTGPDAAGCFADPGCFTNLKLVEALGNLELLESGLTSDVAGAKLADRAALRRATLNAVGRLVPSEIGRAARARGVAGGIALGVLSDPPSHPLAYHALSTAMLARALAKLGDSAPPRALTALRRATETLAAFAGPDGDVSYIGRGQQQAFAPAMTALAGAAAARRLPRPAAAAARFDALSQRGLERLVETNGFGPSGVNIAPRLGAKGSRGYAGIDHYANTVVYNGLSLFALELAADEAAADAQREAPPATGAAKLQADGDGHFVDRDRARFATVRRRAIWFSVHERQQRADLRDDFGLVALKQRRGDRWVDLLRPRPLTQGADSAGPILLAGRERGLPFGERLDVSKSGVVTVVGGFRTARGRVLRDGVEFRFEPLSDGVRVSVPGRAGDRFQFQTFLPHAQARKRSGGGADERSSATTDPAPAAVELVDGFASCCDRELVAARATVRLERAGPVSHSIRARRETDHGGGRGWLPVPVWVLPASLGGAAVLAAGGLLLLRR